MRQRGSGVLYQPLSLIRVPARCNCRAEPRPAHRTATAGTGRLLRAAGRRGRQGRHRGGRSARPPRHCQCGPAAAELRPAWRAVAGFGWGRDLGWPAPRSAADPGHRRSSQASQTLAPHTWSASTRPSAGSPRSVRRVTRQFGAESGVGGMIRAWDLWRNRALRPQVASRAGWLPVRGCSGGSGGRRG